MTNILERFNPGYYENCGDYKAFHPSEVLGEWKWTDSKLNHLLSEANKELGGLNTYSELVSDIDVYILMHLQVEANKSNKIEGTRTSVEDDMMDIEDVVPEKRDDVQEIKNYVAAMNHGINRIVKDDFPFTTRLIRELHSIILSGVRGEHKTPGEFRTSQNWIGGSRPSNAIYVPPSVSTLSSLLSDLDKFMNADDHIPELVKIAIIHYQFETIHPFLDGNGRIGRLIIPLYLLSKKELTKPCFYISDYFEKNKIEYYNRLQLARTEGDLLGWVNFFLEASISTAQTAKEKFRRAIHQEELYSNYLIGKTGGSTKSLQKIVTAMYKNPVASATKLSAISGLSAPTVNKCVQTLVDDGILVEITGNRRNRIFALVDYIAVFN